MKNNLGSDKMKNDVFISYSTTDKHVADAICATLEGSGIRCWIAPRDIFPGSDWAQSITNAIKESKLMILVFSQNSNGSSQVTKELNLAINNNLMILPFKIDNSVPSGSMEYFLADMHWLDAIDGDMQEQINKLKDVVSSVLPHNIKDEPEKTAVNAPVTKKSKQGFFEPYKMFWKKTFDYKGCCARSEFFKALLFNLIIAFVIWLLQYMFDDILLFLVLLIYISASCIPFVSLCVRRLHDTGRRGWWVLLYFIPWIGTIALIIMLCQKSDEDRDCLIS